MASAYMDDKDWKKLSEAERRAIFDKAHAEAQDAKTDPKGTAALALAWAYEAGYGCKADDEAAVKWFTTSLDRGCVQARTTLGCRHFERKNYDKALPLFEASVADGDGDACWHLGRMHRDALGIPKNAKRAFDLFETGAYKHNNSMCWNSLGLAYEDGLSGGCERSLHFAQLCFTMAAHENHPDGPINLARVSLAKTSSKSS